MSGIIGGYVLVTFAVAYCGIYVATDRYARDKDRRSGARWVFLSPLWPAMVVYGAMRGLVAAWKVAEFPRIKSRSKK